MSVEGPYRRRATAGQLELPSLFCLLLAFRPLPEAFAVFGLRAYAVFFNRLVANLDNPS